MSVVQQGMKYIDEVQDSDVRLQLINVLREITAGKIFLELESARLTKMLSRVKEAQGMCTAWLVIPGDIKEAAAILHELQIETYGSMDQKEKADYLLDQVLDIRVCCV